MTMKHPVEYELDYLEKIDYTKPGWRKLLFDVVNGYTVTLEIEKLREFALKGYDDRVTEACNAKADEWQARLDAIVARMDKQ